MAITNGYATLTQIKNRLKITGSTEDTFLEDAVNSASREIDKHCGRRFYKDADASARVYRTNKSVLAVVEEFYTTTGLVIETDTAGDGTYATAWSASDYELLPLNGIVDGESGWPFRKIKAISGRRFITASIDRPAQLRVTARWGWNAVPDPVYQACLIMAQANYKLKDSTFGTVGVGDVGMVTVTQVPAAVKKLKPYVLKPVKAG